MYYKNPNIVVRKVEPSYFMVDITKCYNNDVEKMFITDDIGNNIWNVIEDGDSFDDIYIKFLDLITDEKTDELLEMIKNDLHEYLLLLIKNDCLEVRG